MLFFSPKFLSAYSISYLGSFTSIFKDKKLVRNHKIAKIKVFRHFFCSLIEGSVLITTDLDPEGPRT